MSFVLVGYPVVAPNYFQHDPLDQPPHPVLAQILRTVADSRCQAQVATFMASATDIGKFKYFNHTFMNGAVDADVMEAAEFQAASIMTAAAEEASFDPYMSFGYRDDPEVPPIEKLDNYDYYDQDDCVSDVDKAVQQQVDQHEVVCSSSSYPSPVEDDRSLRYDPSSVDNYRNTRSTNMPKRKYADVIAKSVTQEQPIRDRCISAAAIPERTNDDPRCNYNETTPLQEQFPELPKRDTHVCKTANPYASSRLPIDYAAIVKRNVIQPPKITMSAYANLPSKDQLLRIRKLPPNDEVLCQEAVSDSSSPSLQSPTDLCAQEQTSECTMINGSQDGSVAEQEEDDDARFTEQQQPKPSKMSNYADVVKRPPKHADIAKRKACSPPEYAPSKKIMKQENSLTVRTEKVQEPGAVTSGDDSVALQPHFIRDQDPKMDLTAPQSFPSTVSKSPETIECYDNLAPEDTKPQNITPYAEIVRRSSAKGHSSTCGDSGGVKGGTPSRPKLLASFDRLEQLLVRPARIPWVETGDPLMQLYQKERKQANDYGYNMNECFKLSQKYYHAKDWINAKRYSNEGHYYRQRMHKLHTQASRRIFEQRNQQHALFIDLHGMHVDEAQANIDRWFQELENYRGIVYIVTGTGHHSRTGTSKKESKLRPAVHAYLCNMYRCEETSVLGDDKGGVFAVYLCPHRFNRAITYCVYCKFRPIK